MKTPDALAELRRNWERAPASPGRTTVLALLDDLDELYEDRDDSLSKWGQSKSWDAEAAAFESKLAAQARVIAAAEEECKDHKLSDRRCDLEPCELCAALKAAKTPAEGVADESNDRR